MRNLFKYFLIDAICTFTFLIFKIITKFFSPRRLHFPAQFSKNEDYFHRSKKTFLWKHEFWKRTDIFLAFETACGIMLFNSLSSKVVAL